MVRKPAPDRLDPNQVLQHSCIARDLREVLDGERRLAGRDSRLPVMIEMNNAWPGGSRFARAALVAAYLNDPARAAEAEPADRPDTTRELLALAQGSEPWAGAVFARSDRLNLMTSGFTEAYLFGRLTRRTIRQIARACQRDRNTPIYKIWLDQPCDSTVYRSFRTVKCDAAQIAFGARGENIVWAVADSGIDGSHPHFATHGTLDLPKQLGHFDFTEENHASAADSAAAALTDSDGHGTHVAGIIAGETRVASEPDRPGTVRAIEIDTAAADEAGRPQTDQLAAPPELIQGVAPLARVMSLKVLPDEGSGQTSAVIAAIGYVQQKNEYGRNLRIHGLNLSLGYPFRQDWFAAGQSPICKEVNRLVRSGVVVVVAAGNSGFGFVSDERSRFHSSTHASTISDPGNAELAITVGSTHRDQPHEYGVSYFSAKGPTIDGRLKPDILAPGERIVSCAPGSDAAAARFRELSGTSMAAPHVSGMIAALMSIRREFIGQPERIKRILLDSATDLGRAPTFQGAGLADLMRALQSI